MYHTLPDLQSIVHWDLGVGGSNARRHVAEETRNAPGVLFSMLCLGAIYVLTAIVKQGYATVSLAQVIRE